ncbi:unnamed protein product, partial [Prorocentrum cordatum]
ICMGWRKSGSDPPAPLLGGVQTLTDLSQVIEEMQRQMERQNQDSLEQKSITGSLHSEVGCLRRRIAERDCDVASAASTSDDWARADALELDNREVGEPRHLTSEETQAIPVLNGLASSELLKCEGNGSAEHLMPSLKPGALEHSPRRAPAPCRAPGPSLEAPPTPTPSASVAFRAHKQGKRARTSAQHLFLAARHATSNLQAGANV